MSSNVVQLGFVGNCHKKMEVNVYYGEKTKKREIKT